eukprot:GFYU01002113.1.p1 GENE.GFYU01002113.1~~GFYU01002113.1.p1  ORF type:complete len:319 (-),score=58.13 GFYU01002113.1:56-1012(-)
MWPLGTGTHHRDTHALTAANTRSTLTTTFAPRAAVEARRQSHLQSRASPYKKRVNHAGHVSGSAPAQLSMSDRCAAAADARISADPLAQQRYEQDLRSQRLKQRVTRGSGSLPRYSGHTTSAHERPPLQYNYDSQQWEQPTHTTATRSGGRRSGSASGGGGGSSGRYDGSSDDHYVQTQSRTKQLRGQVSHQQHRSDPSLHERVKALYLDDGCNTASTSDTRHDGRTAKSLTSHNSEGQHGRVRRIPGGGSGGYGVQSVQTIHSNKDLPDGICVICQERFQLRQDVSRLMCCHAFHTRCINKWLQKKNTCPVDGLVLT